MKYRGHEIRVPKDWTAVEVESFIPCFVCGTKGYRTMYQPPNNKRILCPVCVSHEGPRRYAMRKSSKPGVIYSPQKTRTNQHRDPLRSCSTIRVGPRPLKRRKPRHYLNSHEYIWQAKRKLTDRATRAEKCLMQILDDAQIPYIFQYVIEYKGWIGIADFWLPTFAAFVEVDGSAHNSEEQQAKDRIKDYICTVCLHRKIVRLTNHQVFTNTPSDVIDRIQNNARPYCSGQEAQNHPQQLAERRTSRPSKAEGTEQRIPGAVEDRERPKDDGPCDSYPSPRDSQANVGL